MNKDRELMQQALEALELAKNSHSVLLLSDPPQDPWKTRRVDSALTQSITALRERLAQPGQEPVTALPSSTRYTVEVEGQARTYWDNVHDAITNAQRAVYAGVDATTRAIDDLRSGRIAEWSYGFSAVRIYPPQRVTPPRREWVGLTDEDLSVCDEDGVLLARYWEAKLREKNA